LRLVVALLTSLFLCWPGATRASAQQSDRPVVTIGIIYDGPVAGTEVLALQGFLDLQRQIQEEFLVLTRRDFDARFPIEQRLQGDWALPTIVSALDRLLENPEVDLVLALGPISSALAASRKILPKPVIAPFIVDADAQNLSLVDNRSGVKNLNYLVRTGSSRRDLAKFNALVPFDVVHVLVDATFIEAVPTVRTNAHEISAALGLTYHLVPVASSADPALAALDGAEAVYFTPFLRLPLSEFHRLVRGVNQRGIPSFSLQGEIEVQRGVMACLRRVTDTKRMARRIALNMQRVLLGEDAGTLPVTLDQPERLLINLATAEAVGFHPRWRVTLEADVINEPGPWGHRLADVEPLTLTTAVREAVASNLALQASARGVQATAQNVNLARSTLKPGLELSSTMLQIDEDRAEGSFGLQRERTVSGTIGASQILYSDRALANFDISKNAQRAVEMDWEAQRLDVALGAATAFLNVLRAQVLEGVEQENLRLTESNLQLARRRETVGFSGPADVYRWESRLATDRSNLITAHSVVHSAFIVLNQVLHRPMEQLYELQPPDIMGPDLVTGFGRLGPYIDNMAGFELFREFSVREGLADAPELQALDALIEARERELLASRRSYWSPDLSLFGEFERTFSESGAGEAGTILGQTAGSSMDRDDWSVGLLFTLPLYAGGAREARVRQAGENLAELRLERDTAAERVELRIRTALFAVASTFPAIELAQEAAEAGRKNLELVTDSYSRGAVSIIDLLDAQNASLRADAFAANAIYDFLIDLVELQRSANNFDFFRSDEGRREWFERLAAFFAKSGFEVDPR
jgi:outer membrane protein TolC/ABC-type uncharacterized transport system substrate-binding protein